MERNRGTRVYPRLTILRPFVCIAVAAACLFLQACAGRINPLEASQMDSVRADNSASALTNHFTSARAIWPAGRSQERNLFVGFRAIFDAPASGPVVLRVTASSVYRAFLNGEFCGYGPARGPHGWYRIDEWDLTARVKPGRNVVGIEVAGYNVNSYYLLDQPAFLEAEVVGDGRVLAATGAGESGFAARILSQRLQRVQRYSFQRPFCEMYGLTPASDLWRVDAATSAPAVAVEIGPPKNHLPRHIPFPAFSVLSPAAVVAEGRIKSGITPAHPWGDQSLTQISPRLGGYKVEELEAVLSRDVESMATVVRTPVDRPVTPESKMEFARDSFQIVDFGGNYTGFPGATIRCTAPTRLYFAFDEILSDGDVNCLRLNGVSAIRFDLQPGEYTIEAFEPYTMRYLKLILADGDCTITNLYLREYANDDVWRAEFASSNGDLDRLFGAARQTYRQNAVDVFTDCPSRERAGWLCDSFFTARAAFDLSGNTSIERNFLENFLLPERFPNLPEGMLPMCYPADHPDGGFIPNWALWFVVQLEEYADRGGDRELITALEPRVMALFTYLAPFRNPDGLLEKLPSWVFVEWSEANRFVQDVNYPSNMLYAGALSAAGRLYGRADLLAAAERIRDVIRRQSFDGQFFVDNAMRNDGALEITGNHSEVCQYYSFYFDVATPATHSELWRVLLDEFGPGRAASGTYPEVHPANAFIGNVLRLELLSRAGRSQQLLDESLAYHGFMAERTGTLWEHNHPGASCNHGFASHLAHVCVRDMLGVRRIDPVERTVHVRIPRVDLERCSGRVPVGGDVVSLEWWKAEGRLGYRLNLPAGFDSVIENDSGMELVRQP